MKTQKKKKTKFFDIVSALYNKFLDKNYDEYYDLEKEQKEELGYKFKLINSKLKTYDYGKLYNKTSDNNYDDYKEEKYIDFSDMPPIEIDKKVKEEKGLKI